MDATQLKNHCKKPIDLVGGEEGVRALVNTFYDLMEQLPEARSIHDLHSRGHGLRHTRIEQERFMIGFFGGRQRYVEKHGHMNLKEIHAHIPIRDDDVENWISTWEKALEHHGYTGVEFDDLKSSVRRVAQKLQNDLPDWRKGETL